MLQARMLFESILAGGHPGIEAMVGTQDEHIFIDMKRKSRPNVVGTEKSDRDTYCKALSGFSNSAGGVVIWGVDCKKDKDNGLDVVQGLEPISNLKRFIGELNQHLPQAVQPLNPGIENHPILVPGESDTGFVVTYVPESDLTPHRSLGDHLYWVRSGNNFVRVDHPMLADMFGRRQRPKLEFAYKVGTGESIGRETRCRVQIGIKNTGRFVAVYPAIVIRPGKHPLYGEPPSSLPRDMWCIRQQYVPNMLGLNSLDGSFMWAGGINDVIHPNTTLPLTSIDRLLNFSIDVIPSQDLHFKYELYAEGCQPVDGELTLTTARLAKAMNVPWPPVSH